MKKCRSKSKSAMKHFILTAIFAARCWHSTAQTIDGVVALATQAEVTAFASATTEVTGNLTIGAFSDTNISDLSNLSNLETVGGNLVIASNPNRTSLSNFNNLTSLGGNLSIQLSGGFTSLEGLESITSVKQLGNAETCTSTKVDNLILNTQTAIDGAASSFTRIAGNLMVNDTDANNITLTN